MASAGNAANQDVERRQIRDFQRPDVGLNQCRFRVRRLPHVGKARFDLDSSLDDKVIIAGQGGRHGSAAREHFQYPERGRQAAASQDGCRPTGRTDLKALEPAGDLQLREFAQLPEVGLVGDVDDGAQTIGGPAAGDVVLGQDRGAEDQFVTLRFDGERGARREGQGFESAGLDQQASFLVQAGLVAEA